MFQKVEKMNGNSKLIQGGRKQSPNDIRSEPFLSRRGGWVYIILLKVPTSWDQLSFHWPQTIKFPRLPFKSLWTSLLSIITHFPSKRFIDVSFVFPAKSFDARSFFLNK